MPADTLIEPTATSAPAGTRQSPLLPAAAWFAVIAWAGTIYWLSSRPGPEIDELNLFNMWDKGAHFLAFFAGAPALVCGLKWTTRWSWMRVALTAAAIASLYGAADEIHQLYTPKRSGADVYDWTADSLGGIAGAFATILVYVRLERSRLSRRRAS